MTEQTYSLGEVAQAHLPAEWTDAIRWLTRRLNSGQLTGYRVGRTWRMRERHVQYLLDKYSNDGGEVGRMPTPVVRETKSVLDGLSQRSRNRLRKIS